MTTKKKTEKAEEKQSPENLLKYSHLSQEFQQLQPWQSEHEPVLPAHTISNFLGPLPVQVGRTQNLQPNYKTPSTIMVELKPSTVFIWG